MPETKYFWIATLQWPVPNGFRVWSNHGYATSDGTTSRLDVLKGVFEMAATQTGETSTAEVLFFSVEPEMLPGGAS